MDSEETLVRQGRREREGSRGFRVRKALPDREENGETAERGGTEEKRRPFPARRVQRDDWALPVQEPQDPRVERDQKAEPGPPVPRDNGELRANRVSRGLRDLPAREPQDRQDDWGPRARLEPLPRI